MPDHRGQPELGTPPPTGAEHQVAILPLDTRWVAVLPRLGESASLDLLRAIRQIDGTDTSGPSTLHADIPHPLREILPASALVHRAVAKLRGSPVTLKIELPAAMNAALPVAVRLAMDAGMLRIRVGAFRARQLPDHLRERPALADGLASVTTLADAERFARRLTDAGFVSSAFDGPQPSGQLSTEITLPLRGGYTISRSGAASAEMIASRLAFRVLFVCTGNTCRSPMAEAIARDLAAGLPAGSIPLLFSSAGVGAALGSPPTPESVDALRAMGIAPPVGRAQQLTTDLARQADMILTMTEPHQREARRIAPGVLVNMLDLNGQDVPDPIGQGPAAYRRTAERLRQLVSIRLDDLRSRTL